MDSRDGSPSKERSNPEGTGSSSSTYNPVRDRSKKLIEKMERKERELSNREAELLKVPDEMQKLLQDARAELAKVLVVRDYY